MLETMDDRASSFDYEALLACGRGELFGEGNAQLPLPPMLMFDRITAIGEEGGEHGKGQVRAELDVKPDLWFFSCHFKGDPVMPGCLGLDALWQMLGFFLGWLGAPGRGRALSVGEVKFSGMVLPTAKLVEYGVDLKRVLRSKLVLGIADGWLKVDGETIYQAKDLKVGLFQGDGRSRRSAERGRQDAAAQSGPHRRRNEEGRDEAGRRHGHGHRVLDRQQHAGGARLAARGAVRHRRAPRTTPSSASAARCTARRHSTPTTMIDRRAMRFHGGGTAWNHVAMDQAIQDAGPRARATSRTSAPASSWARAVRRRAPSSRRPTSPATKGPKRVGPFAVPKAMSLDRLGDARHLVQDQGRQLFDLVGLRDLEPLHRQRLRD